MKIVNAELILPKAQPLTSKYIERELEMRGIDFIRWAITSVNEESFTLNVSYKKED